MSQADPTQEQCNRYARAWLEKNDMTRAWRAAFPESKAADESAYVKACNLHKNIKIRLRITQLEEASKKQSEEEFTISIADRKKWLKKAVALGYKENDKGMAHSISGAVSAINELNKMDGAHATKKIDLTNSDGSLMPSNWNEFYEE